MAPTIELKRRGKQSICVGMPATTPLSFLHGRMQLKLLSVLLTRGVFCRIF